MNNQKTLKAFQAVLCVTPVILIILLIRAYPIVESLSKSLTSWDGLSPARWVGFDNFISIFGDREFWVSLSNNLLLLLHIPLKLLAGLIFALLLYEEVVGWKIFRSISFFPQVVSAAIIGYLFSILFSYEGPINLILRAAGLESFAIEWMGERASGILVMVICLIWQGIGYQALLITGGLSSISPSLFEAARIEGANYWQRLFKIVLPMLIRVVEYLFVMNVAWVFTGLFPFVFSLTKGGPGYSTSTIDFMIYTKAFIQGNNYGIPCALSVILLIIVLAFTVVQMNAANKVDDWSGGS